eukprot:303145_1
MSSGLHFLRHASTMSAFALNLNFLFIVYIPLLCPITCQYTTIWYDDMSSNSAGHWSVRSSSYTVFGASINSCESGTCCYTNGGDGYDEWTRRYTDISSYSSIRLQLYIATYAMYSGSTCNVYYSYSSSSSSSKILIKEIDPPDSSSSRYTYPDTTIDFPSSASADTIWIWLYSDSPSSTQTDYCVWDNVYLKGIQNGGATSAPTPSPTPAPNPGPTKRPSKSPSEPPTNSPSKSPSKPPTKSQSELPSTSPSKSPTKFPSKRPTLIVHRLPTKSPTKSPIDTDTTATHTGRTTESEQENDEDERAITSSSDADFMSKVMIAGVVVTILGCMLTVVWVLYCYLRRHAQKKDEENMINATDHTGKNAGEIQSIEHVITGEVDGDKGPGYKSESHDREEPEDTPSPELPQKIPENGGRGLENHDDYVFETPGADYHDNASQ